MRTGRISGLAVALAMAAAGIALAQVTPVTGTSPSASAATSSASTVKPQASAGQLSAAPEDFSKLKIQAGFLLDVEIFDETDLSGQYRVDSDGTVTLPFVGKAQVAGDTAAEAEGKIESAYEKADILKHPQITVNIVQYAPTLVNVLGEVNSPGRLQLLAPHSLLDVLSLVGGETQLAGTTIDVRHQDGDKTVTSTYHYGRNSNGESIGNVMVQDGDTVIVPRAGIVYVLGQVQRPGGYLMQEDGKLDVAQALSLALGTTLLASTEHIIVIRRNADGTYTQFVVDYQKMVKGKMTPPALQAQDIVYVPNSKIKTAFADVQGVLTSAATATIYRFVD